MYDALRLAVGLLLLIAATLKGYQLATSPTLDTHVLNTRWFLILTVEYELLLGLWLLGGWRRREAWLIALISFMGFTCITFYKVLLGEVSCGCFGLLEVNPWLTLVLDLVVVAALLTTWPPTGASSTIRHSVRSPRLIATLALATLLGAPAGYLMAGFTPAELTGEGDLFANSEFVVLEPDTWVGKRFPLLNYIDIGDQLATGKWVVVLYRHDCPHCIEELPKYERLARETANEPDAPRVALIELPPYAQPGFNLVASDSQCISGHLNDTLEWFIQTPCIIWLTVGLVSDIGLPPN